MTLANYQKMLYWCVLKIRNVNNIFQWFWPHFFLKSCEFNQGEMTVFWNKLSRNKVFNLEKNNIRFIATFYSWINERDVVIASFKIWYEGKYNGIQTKARFPVNRFYRVNRFSISVRNASYWLSLLSRNCKLQYHPKQQYRCNIEFPHVLRYLK